MRITESQLRRIIRQTINEMAPAGSADPLLTVLSKVLTYEVGPQDVKYITFQPHMSGGVVTKINVTHRDPDMGDTESMILPVDVRDLGMSLDDLAGRLGEMGAKSQVRRPPMKRAMPYYD
jgi:hypothetical protein